MSDFTDEWPALTHYHYYRPSIADWWCGNCNTVTDYCQQLNPV